MPTPAPRRGAGSAEGRLVTTSAWQRPRLLAICADDYGLHAGIDEAVLSLLERGRLNAVSCQVGGPAWRADAPALADVAGRCRQAPDLGLHLDLTEAPQHPALRRRLPQLQLAALMHRLDGAALRDEIEAQLDAFESALGRPPAYVDGHQHVHQLPLVREALLAVLARRYPAQRPWLRRTRRPARLPDEAELPLFKPWLIERLGDAALARLAQAAGHGLNGHLLGVYGFDCDAAGYRRRLLAWLGVAVDGDLLMCHPGVTDAGDVIAAARAAEWTVFDDDGFDELLALAGVELRSLSRQRAEAAA